MEQHIYNPDSINFHSAGFAGGLCWFNPMGNTYGPVTIMEDTEITFDGKRVTTAEELFKKFTAAKFVQLKTWTDPKQYGRVVKAEFTSKDKQE